MQPQRQQAAEKRFQMHQWGSYCYDYQPLCWFSQAELPFTQGNHCPFWQFMPTFPVVTDGGPLKQQDQEAQPEQRPLSSKLFTEEMLGNGYPMLLPSPIGQQKIEKVQQQDPQNQGANEKEEHLSSVHNQHIGWWNTIKSEPNERHKVENIQPHSSKENRSLRLPKIRLLYENFKQVVNSSPENYGLEELIMQQKAVLLAIMEKKITEDRGRFKQHYLDSQIMTARKNTTYQFAKLLRLAIKFMREEQGKCLSSNRFQKRIKGSKVNIRGITTIFREEQFAAVMQYLRNRIFVEQKLPALVMILDIKPSEKYVMMPMVNGFLYALHHPEEDFTSWDLHEHTLAGDTSPVVNAIRTNDIGYEEIRDRVNAIYTKLLETHPKIGKCSKYNNISYNYQNKLVRIFKAMLRGIRSKEQHSQVEKRFEEIDRSSSSIETVRQLLKIEELRAYTKAHYIDKKQLLIDLLEEGSLSCHNKKIMVESYPKFVEAVENPDALVRWR